MKILVLSTSYPEKDSPYKGIFTHQQVKALQKHGIECHVIQPVNWYPPFHLHSLHPYWKEGYDARVKMLDTYEGVTIHHPRMFVKMPSRIFPETYDVRMANAIVRYVKKNKYLNDIDLIWSHFLFPEGRVAVNVSKALNIPLVAMILGDDVHAWPEENLSIQKDIKIVLRDANVLIANSKRLASDTYKWMDEISGKEVFTVYNGVDYEKFKPALHLSEKQKIREKFQLEESKKYMICVARAVIMKGWLELFDSIKALSSECEGWELLMVAPPPLFAHEINLIEEAKNRGVDSKVRNIGKINSDDLAELMKVCDLFVMPSYNEGLSNAVLEALSAGLPVVTTEVGGHAEVIENGKDGYLIQPKSGKELTDVMRKILTDEPLRKTLGANGRLRMLQFGDYETNSKKLIYYFQKACESKISA